MTPAQQQSMQHALVSFVEQAEKKYRDGQAEHGGNLWERDNLLKDVNQEIIDQMFYTKAIEQKVGSVIEILNAALFAAGNAGRNPSIAGIATITDLILKAQHKLKTL